MADILKKLGDAAKDVYSKVKSIPPDEGEAQALREKQEQVDALAPASAQRLQPMVMPKEGPDPTAAYGTRLGEHRYAVDAEGNLTPVYMPIRQIEGENFEERQPMNLAPAPAPRMKPIIPASLSQPMPVYDQGGDVKMTSGGREVAEPVYTMSVKMPPPQPGDYMPRYGEG